MTMKGGKTRLGGGTAAFALGVLLLTGCPPTGLSGTYQATTPEGSMAIEFKDDQKIEMTMLARGGEPERSEGSYLLDGKNVTVQVPGGIPLVLVRDGRTLTVNMMGEVLVFKKK